MIVLAQNARLLKTRLAEGAPPPPRMAYVITDANQPVYGVYYTPGEAVARIPPELAERYRVTSVEIGADPKGAQ